MRKYEMTDDELYDLACSVANRIWEKTPEIQKVSETRNWLESEALDVLNGVLNKKIEEVNNDTTR